MDINEILSGDNTNYLENKTTEIIHKDIKNSLLIYFKPFLIYKKNEKNIKDTYKYLLNNNFILINSNISLNNGDYIRYFKIKPGIGNDLFLKSGGFVYDSNHLFITITNQKYKWKIYFNKYIIYKKLSNNEIFRVNLNNINHK